MNKKATIIIALFTVTIISSGCQNTVQEKETQVLQMLKTEAEKKIPVEFHQEAIEGSENNIKVDF